MRLSVRTLAVLLFALAAVTDGRSAFVQGRRLKDTKEDSKEDVDTSGGGTGSATAMTFADDDPVAVGFVDVEAESDGPASARAKGFGLGTRDGQLGSAFGRSKTQGTGEAELRARGTGRETVADIRVSASADSEEDGKTRATTLSKAKGGTARLIGGSTVRTAGSAVGRVSVDMDGDAEAIEGASDAFALSEDGRSRAGSFFAGTSDAGKSVGKTESASRGDARSFGVAASGVIPSGLTFADVSVDTQSDGGEAQSRGQTRTQASTGQSAQGTAFSKISGVGQIDAGVLVESSETDASAELTGARVETSGDSEGKVVSSGVADSGHGQTVRAQQKLRTSGDAEAESDAMGSSEAGSVSARTHSSASSQGGGAAHSASSVSARDTTTFP